jgi:quercetin dioxygenase-like cupin family protein
MADASAALTDMNDLPAETFDWGAIKWLCNARLMPGAAQTLGTCYILPGRGNPLHYHPNCEELLYVISGRGRHSLDGRWLDLKAGMTLRIPSGVRHNLINDGWEPLTCLISFSSGDRQTVFLE